MACSELTVIPGGTVNTGPVRAEVFSAYDAQLMTGIEELKKAMAADPRPWPKHPPFKADK